MPPNMLHGSDHMRVNAAAFSSSLTGCWSALHHVTKPLSHSVHHDILTADQATTEDAYSRPPRLILHCEQSTDLSCNFACCLGVIAGACHGLWLIMCDAG